MKYKIRTMNAEDFASVINLWKKTPGIGLDNDCDSKSGLLRYLTRNPGLSFVAIADKSIIGAVLSGHDGRRGYLHHLAVSVEFRKHGIAKALIQNCFKKLKANNIPKCNVFLFNTNKTGKSFWKHNGWNHRKDLSILQKKTIENKSN